MSEIKPIYVVTGANGYIASALVRRLVDAGAHVRATVRRAQAGESLRSSLTAEAKGYLEIRLVQDITAEKAFRDALQGATHVFHMASPLPAVGKTDVKRDFLDPALSGTLTLLQDAHSTPTVQKIVLTSSVASILSLTRANTGATFTEADWNPITYNEAASLGEKLSTTDKEGYIKVAMTIYAASKKLAEEAAWKFVEDKKPHFKLTTVNPALVIGRPTMGQGLSGTNGSFWQLLNGRPLQPDNTLAGYVDLEDVVEGHVRAMQREEADGKRFLLVGAQSSNWQLVNWAKEHRGEVPFDKVEKPEDAEAIQKRVTRYDTTASKEILGLTYKEPKQMVTDFIDWVLEAKLAESRK
ncbi:uncharacterized protein UTRI_04955 [Ustilago trichophora]|uniref:NAD-dependent epimerase/dehydratase domain-containing protein n=1 Tax=Ustilago trichophora TaxID=86804 RepID=A0A5C3EB13_9BASI|nr:uncharacterized protein UTRI_04955 [Ustilago trichophora]